MNIITWVDLDGRYRVTSPAYTDMFRRDETADELVARLLPKLRARYGLPDNHSFHLVENADQHARLVDLAGTYFRYGIFDNSPQAGAWEMDSDGLPTVNMEKARAIKTDKVRVERNRRLADSDKEISRLDGAAVPGPVRAKRVALRNLPATIQPDLNALSTPVMLEAWQPVWPE